MKNFYDDHSGDDEVHPVVPEDVDSDPTATEPAYPDFPLPGDSIYRDPTQPVEPIYPVPEDVEEVRGPVDSDDESLFERFKRWITGDKDRPDDALADE